VVPVAVAVGGSGGGGSDGHLSVLAQFVGDHKVGTDGGNKLVLYIAFILLIPHRYRPPSCRSEMYCLPRIHNAFLAEIGVDPEFGGK
jgi:hypothetical protein